MANIDFMKSQYTLDTLLSHYLEAINGLRGQVNNAQDEGKLQRYYQAAKTFKRLSIKDLAQFAITFGKGTSGQSAIIKEAFPTLLGYRIAQPSPIDLAYLQLLLVYAKAFKQYKSNLKDWALKFLLNSQFSPLKAYLEREIDQVIVNTQNNIVRLKSGQY